MSFVTKSISSNKSLKDQIVELEKESKILEPNEQKRRHLLQLAQNYGEDFLNNMPKRPVYQSDLTALDKLTDGKYDRPHDEKDVFDMMHSAVDNTGLDPASGGHLGYIPGGGIYSSAIADYLAAITNRYAGLFYGNPGAVRLENDLLDWTARLMKFPKSTLGNITSGGSIANLIALTTARDSKNITAERISKSVIYLTSQTHHCIQKAIRIAGLHYGHTTCIPVDENYRMDTNALSTQIEKDKAAGLLPFFVVASCGTTNVGAVDNFEIIAEICDNHGLWFHIDAAYGGYFALVDALKPLFRGIDRADSIVLDPHKSLFLPYGTGIVLIRDGQKLLESYHYTASYLQDAYNNDSSEVSPADLGPELTKHFRALRLWLPLKMYGFQAFGAALEEKHLLTMYLYEHLQKIGFEVGPRPQLSVCIYRYIPKTGEANSFNEKLVDEIKNDGQVFVSSTMIEGVFWIRAAILSFRTHLSTIDMYINLLREKIIALEE